MELVSLLGIALIVPVPVPEPFIPKPEEIRQACAEIQAEWSPAEACRRARGVLTGPKGGRR